MFMAELGVGALCLEFYPGPSCMGTKKQNKEPSSCCTCYNWFMCVLVTFFFPPNIHTSVLCINEEVLRCGRPEPGLQKKSDNTEETDKAVKLVLVKHGMQHLHFVMVLQRERTVHG